MTLVLGRFGNVLSGSLFPRRTEDGQIRLGNFQVKYSDTVPTLDKGEMLIWVSTNPLYDSCQIDNVSSKWNTLAGGAWTFNGDGFYTDGTATDTDLIYVIEQKNAGGTVNGVKATIYYSKLETGASNRPIICFGEWGGGTHIPDEGYYLTLAGAQLRVRYNAGGSEDIIDISAALSEDTWHDVELYKEGAYLILKVDGVTRYNAVNARYTPDGNTRIYFANERLSADNNDMQIRTKYIFEKRAATSAAILLRTNDTNEFASKKYLLPLHEFE